MDCIEMRPALLFSPRVQKMARFLQNQTSFVQWAFPYLPDARQVPMLGTDIISRVVVATLMNVWATARKLAPDGFFGGATHEEIDSIAGVPCFATAMQRVGWLELRIDGIVLPNFAEHNPTGKAERARPAGRRQDEDPDGFDRFWAAYPKKAGKGAARAAWRKIRPGKQLVETILQAVEIHKRSEQWLRDKGRYVPNPATWLNQTRWEDVPESCGGEGAAERLARIERQQAEMRRQRQAEQAAALPGDRVREMLKGRGLLHRQLVEQRVEEGKQL